MFVTQSCLTLCDSMDYSLPGSSVHEIVQVRILECVAMPFSRGSSQPRYQNHVSRIAGRFFTIWVTQGVLNYAANVSMDIWTGANLKDILVKLISRTFLACTKGLNGCFIQDKMSHNDCIALLHVIDFFFIS